MEPQSTAKFAVPATLDLFSLAFWLMMASYQNTSSFEGGIDSVPKKLVNIREGEKEWQKALKVRKKINRERQAEYGSCRERKNCMNF